MSRNVTVALAGGAGADLGPNFNVTITGGTISPTTVTKASLSDGQTFSISSDAAETITITSTGVCTNPATIVIPAVDEAVHNFSSTPVPGGILGNLFITAGTAPSSIFLTGSPFIMSPFSLNPPSTNATINFTNGSFTKNTTISFTLGSTSTATPFSNLRIQDNLGTTYNSTVSGGSGTGNNVVVTFNLGAPSNRTFGFLGGEINLQFPS